MTRPMRKQPTFAPRLRPPPIRNKSGAARYQSISEPHLHALNHFPEGIKWYRLNHPTDRGQWIGIGVYEHHNTGWTAYWVMCRVPVGFEVDT